MPLVTLHHAARPKACHHAHCHHHAPDIAAADAAAVAELAGAVDLAIAVAAVAAAAAAAIAAACTAHHSDQEIAAAAAVGVVTAAASHDDVGGFENASCQKGCAAETQAKLSLRSGPLDRLSHRSLTASWHLTQQRCHCLHASPGSVTTRCIRSAESS